MSYDKDEDREDGSPPSALPPGWRRPDAGPKATPGPRYSPRRQYERRPLLPATGAPLPPPRRAWRRWVPVGAVVLVTLVALGWLLRVVLPDDGGVAQAPSPADQPTDLEVGGTMAGEVVEGPVRISVALSEDEAVQIDVRATDAGFDPVLAVYGPDHDLVGTNDDAERGVLDSRLVVAPLASGVYELEVRGWFTTRGSFTVSVTPA